MRPFPRPPSIRIFRSDSQLQIAMPIGGIGAGCLCLSGNGGLQDFSLRHRPGTTALPDGHSARESAFATVRVVGGGRDECRLVEGPFPPGKIYDQGLQAQGYRQGGHEGLPRFESCIFRAGYPFGRVDLQDSAIPLRTSLTGWSPLIPGDDHSSSLPCAMLEYAFQNSGLENLRVEFAFHLSHPVSTHESDLPRSRNCPLSDGSGIFFTNTEDPGSEVFGSAALAVVGHQPRIKAMWLRGAWFDWISALWREVSTGTFTENDGSSEMVCEHRNGGSVMVEKSLKPGETLTVPVLIAWHFPNSNLALGQSEELDGLTGESVETECDGCGGGESLDPAWKPYYAGYYEDAGDVAADVAKRYGELRTRTLAFSKALFSSTAPPEILDAVSSNFAILKSPTILRQENGNIWAWEGCFTGAGCCHGSCTHVWNYAQSLPHLFPKLERTLREQEFLLSMDRSGHVNFRSALPDGPTTHDHHPAADGQLGGILKLYRDWHISGDTPWMRSLFPASRRSLEYCIRRWDPDERGALFEPHHNTYDIEFWGPDGMCTSIYVGALSAMAELCDAAGESRFSERYRTLARRGASFMDDVLFNGEYFAQSVAWRDLRDRSFAELIEKSDAPPEMLAILRAEGPKYQYGDGCLSDGVIGAWMAAEYGVPSPLSAENVRATLRAIFRHNFQPDLFRHACTQRPGYAMGHEPGLLLCTWPRGNKPTLPFVYCDEVWSGIEYQVASHLIHEGLVKEALTIVGAVRSRHNGRVRNPFNEYECGSYYARAMASYALLTAYAGFRYSAVERILHLAPKATSIPFVAFFSVETGFGKVQIDHDTLVVTMVEGFLAVERVCLRVMEEIDTREFRLMEGSAATCECPLKIRLIA